MSCCDDENGLGVPKGDQGDPGFPGTDGANGVNAYTSSTLDFLQPAVNTTVTITVSNATWIGVGQIIFVENGGYYQVAGTSSTTVTVSYSSAYTAFNQALTGVGGTIASGRKISPGGLAGI